MANFGDSLVGGLTGGLISTGVGLLAGGVKYLLGAKQRRLADAIHPYDPGYQMNNEVIDNARITGDEYNNYGLPGYSKILNNLNNSYTTGLNRATQGATSSADVQDAANKLQYGHDQQLNQLATQAEQGKQTALTRWLASKAASGAEYQNKNAYDNQRFQQLLGQKAELQNASNVNTYGAADQAAKLVSSIFSYRGGNTATGPTGQIKTGSPIFDSPVSTPNFTSDSYTYRAGDGLA